MINLTPVASTKVKEIMQMQSPVPVALRVAVVGGGCSGFQYHMAFENQTNETDELLDFNGLKVAVDQMSSMYLEGVGDRLHRNSRGCGIQVQQSQREEHLRLRQLVQRIIFDCRGRLLRLRISGLLDTRFRSLFYADSFLCRYLPTQTVRQQRVHRTGTRGIVPRRKSP